MENQRGMSLIEVLVTIVIIGIVFVLLSQSMGFFTTANALHEGKQEAVTIAEEELVRQLDKLDAGENISTSYVVGQYLITLHTSELSSGATISTSKLSHRITMAGIYDDDGVPGLLTITVSWGN
ncbi:prepilin-type N-terminal cleavage/methylation domain-containing protein [Alkalihalobacillus sp. AL-G]|uniref:type IV pilus modification PilV family protein n=1 Tax=Alkalihalobacillus sp. AL-G TaxID=2926399 RepID=UPI002729A123|nr:type II secretion system protein [Alkalihalobacillus sp. AL-G]WLD92252.1 type II secretion system GspH family protein [Alkalihalobacillus sp. AL-G]